MGAQTENQTVVTKSIHHYILLWDLCRNDVIIILNRLGDLSSNERTQQAIYIAIHNTAYYYTFIEIIHDTQSGNFLQLKCSLSALSKQLNCCDFALMYCDLFRVKIPIA